MSLETRKIKLIERIIKTDSANLLSRYEQVLPEDIQSLTKSMQADLDAEALARRQGYQGIKRDELDRIADEMALEEPLEELLEQLRS